jgi:hypothetical protein
MELTASFLKNITSFIGDFSGFSNNTTPDDKCYLNSCDCFARFKKCSLNQYVHALPWMCSFKFDRCR